MIDTPEFPSFSTFEFDRSFGFGPDTRVVTVAPPLPASGISFPTMRDLSDVVEQVSSSLEDEFFSGTDVLPLRDLFLDFLSDVRIRTPVGTFEGSAWKEDGLVYVGSPRTHQIALDFEGGLTAEGMRGFVQNFLESRAGCVIAMESGIHFLPDPEASEPIVPKAYEEYILSIVMDDVSRQVEGMGGKCSPKRSKSGLYYECEVPFDDGVKLVFRVG